MIEIRTASCGLFLACLLAVLLSVVGGCSHVRPYAPFVPAISSTGEALRARVILIGDAGRPDEAVLRDIRVWSGKAPDVTAVVFLGDNIYESGMPSGPARREREILDRQMAAVASRHGLFVPGNHDWRNGRAGVVRQMDYVEQTSARLRFLPRDGCPGPAPYAALDGITIIALDTQWLLQQQADASRCGLGDDPDRQFSDRTREMLRDAGQDLVIVVAHHPPKTYGPHGGFYDWRDHLFPLTRIAPWAWIPLPGIGSLYPLARVLRQHSQDATSRRYRMVQRGLADAFAGAARSKPLLFAGGHDHSLQILEGVGSWDYVIVSGAGAGGKLTSVRHGPDTRFAYLHHGFVVVDLMTSGRVVAHVLAAGAPEPVFSTGLTARVPDEKR